MHNHLPKSVVEAISSIEKLPGIGPKSATRLVFYLLNTSDGFMDRLVTNLSELKKKTKFCQECWSVADSQICGVCSDSARNKNQICVIERSIDVINFERMGVFGGVYQVLGGAINPLERVGPDDLKINELIDRVKKMGNSDEIELIIATSLTMEGEATALYIKNRLVELKMGDKLKINRIGMGLPVGSDLSYVDEATLSRALEGKRKL